MTPKQERYLLVRIKDHEEKIKLLMQSLPASVMATTREAAIPHGDQPRGASIPPPSQSLIAKTHNAGEASHPQERSDLDGIHGIMPASHGSVMERR